MNRLLFLRIYASVSALIILLPVSLWADFMLIDNFETGTTGTVPPGWSVTNDGSNETSLLLSTDPADPSNQVAALSGAGTSSNKNGNASRPMDIPVLAESSAATVFLRFFLEDTNLFDGYHHFVGVSKLPAPGSWAEYTAYFGAIDSPPDLLARNQSEGTNVDVGNLVSGQWYHAWIVISNTADRYDLYINTTGDTASASDRVAEDFICRDQANAPIQTILLRLGLAKDEGLRVFYDDLYVDPDQENLENPLQADLSFSEFMQVFYPGIYDPSVVGQSSDPDMDGKPNSWEFNFGTPPDDPTNPGAPGMMVQDGVAILTSNKRRTAPGGEFKAEWNEVLGSDTWQPLEATPNVMGPSAFLPDYYDRVEIYIELTNRP